MTKISDDSDPVFDSEAVVARACDVLGVSSMGALSLELGKSRNRISALVRSGSLPWEDLASICTRYRVSMDWMLWGERDSKTSSTTKETSQSEARVSEALASYKSGDAFIDRDYATRLVLTIVDGVERALDSADEGLSIERKAKAVGALFRMFAIRETLPTQAEIDAIIDLMQ